MITLYEHPLSPYVQKVKIALGEKGVAFTATLPDFVTGDIPDDFLAANPRAEVPALVDGDVSVFDSTIILEYVEDRWPEPPLLPEGPAERARMRMIEDVVDSHYDAVNWGIMEILAFKRAEGDEATRLLGTAAEQTRRLQGWLERHLGDREWFSGARFGWGDLAVVPYVNASVLFGNGPAPGTRLAAWLDRANVRPTVATVAAAAAEAALTGMEQVAALIESGTFQREYRDHRLEWMLRSGGLSIVQGGMADGTIRFSREVS